MEKKNHPVDRKFLIILLTALLALLLALAGFYGNCQKNSPEQNEAVHSGEGTAEKWGILDFVHAAKSIKNDLKLVLTDIKENNLESARNRAGALSGNINALKKPIDGAISVLNGSVPHLQEQLEDIQELLNTADMALKEILLPAIDLLEEQPISNLRVGDGFNTRLLGHYLDFAESVMPKIETVMECVNSVDLSLLDSDGSISGYLETANELMAIYHAEPAIFSLCKSMIGAEQDRLYVIAVQNPVEVRASGGFPGSIGVIRIHDGILTLGDFKSVTYVLSSATPKDIQITGEERELFGYLSGIQTPRDADLCPDFTRVGHIWASAYETMNHEPASGVIAVSPHIVQRLLAVTGMEIELFDGLVLNGENALQVLLHDIYYKYFSVEYVSGREKISDQLFADAAEKTMKMLMDHISVSQLLEYIPVVKESFADRTLMLWMKDETEQEFVTKMGWHGGLNTDPEKPEAGVYYNCILPSKMGWYFLMDTDIGERTRNEDGSYTYPVTVTFTNIATYEEIKSASTYISGGLGGSIRSAAYFFAPAGGTVSDFSASNGQTIKIRTYHGLELGFMDQFLLNPDTPITITYLVTTAPGVETPLVISKTPTAQ